MILESPLIEIPIEILAIILGLVFGSFATCLSERLGNDEDLLKPSHCMKCNARLKIKDLIPFFSYVLLKGRCRYCKSKIEKKYLFLEILMPLAFLLAAIISDDRLEFFLTATIFFTLIIISFVDFKFFIIPHSLNAVLFLSSITYSFVFVGKYNAIIMPIVGFIIGYLIMTVFKKIRKKDGLGFGDVLFMFSCFALLKINSLPIFFLIAGVSGILTSVLLKQNKFPFAPALCFAIFICFLIQKYSVI